MQESFFWVSCKYIPRGAIPHADSLLQHSSERRRMPDSCHNFQLIHYFDAGDFWHARGILPVVPLNIVLSELQNWRRPTLMLVGNHDQVQHICSTLLLMPNTMWNIMICISHKIASMRMKR